MKEPSKAVDAVLQTVEKQFGKGAMMRLGDQKAERVPCIPTGSPSLDDALGYVGIAEDVMGGGWVSARTFRLGASSLLDALLAA